MTDIHNINNEKKTTNNMIESYDSRELASEAAAACLTKNLTRRLAEGGEATLVLSGGTTPGGTMRELAAADLPWDRIHVVLSDERWVPADDPDSNERLVRTELMASGAPANAELLSLFDAELTPAERARSLGPDLKSLPFPFATALLGMGEDGHFASLFPDACNLDDGLDVDGDELAIAVSTEASPHPRISLTLAALSRCDEIVLLAFGDAKRKVLAAILDGADDYPVSALVRQKRAPVRILWAA